MSRIFALMAGNVVENVIVGTLPDYPGSIDVTDVNPRPAPGWIHDGTGFAPPAPTEPVPTTSSRMTHFAFLRRLTLAEHIGIETAMAGDVALRVAKQRFDAARDINVGFAETQQLVGYMAQQGLIDTARLPALLAPIRLDEDGAIDPATGEVTGDRQR